jgi:hypothetical protein
MRAWARIGDIAPLFGTGREAVNLCRVLDTEPQPPAGSHKTDTISRARTAYGFCGKAKKRGAGMNPTPQRPADSSFRGKSNPAQIPFRLRQLS